MGVDPQITDCGRLLRRCQRLARRSRPRCVAPLSEVHATAAGRGERRDDESSAWGEVRPAMPRIQKPWCARLLTGTMCASSISGAVNNKGSDLAGQLPVAEADVVVVGGGGSGLAAAAEAARLGRSVILLEKNLQTGGSTSWSVGSVTATNTPHQRRAGIQDSPQEHFEDLGAHAGALAPRDNLALRRILVDNTTDLLEW